MLKFTKTAFTGAMAVAAFALTSVQAQAATQNADARVTILPAVQLVQDNALNFGLVASSAAAGTVELPSASDTPICSTTVICVGSASRGRFTVSGAANGTSVLISVPGTVTLTYLTSSMTVALASSSTGFAATGAPVTFFVGGTLSVGANQTAGLYQGTYSVSADYQ